MGEPKQGIPRENTLGLKYEQEGGWLLMLDIQTRDSGGSSRRGPSRLLSPHLAGWTPLRGENGDELAIDVVPSEKNETRVLAKQRGLMA